MTRCVVCNTGPLIALGSAGQLDLLHQLFEQVIIPDHVRSEILAGRNDLAVRNFQNAPWIQVRVVTQHAMPLLEMSLDQGESAVILLALETLPDVVLIDERKGRKVAADVYGLHVRGTVGILLDAKKLGLVPRVDTIIATMRQQGYWLDDRIVAEALNKAGE